VLVGSLTDKLTKQKSIAKKLEQQANIQNDSCIQIKEFTRKIAVQEF